MDLPYILLVAIVVVALFFVILAILKRIKTNPVDNSIEIIPERLDYYSGEKINGKIVLKLKDNLKSKKLIAGLRCERVEEISSKKRKYTESHIVFEVNQVLEGEKEYNASEYSYDFSIIVPDDFSELSEDAAGGLTKSVKYLSHRELPHIWYLYVRMECNEVDLVKRFKINVR
jgi:hypothetical protein